MLRTTTVQYFTEHEIRTEKCSNTCQHKTDIFQNEQILVEICTVVLHLSDYTGQHQKCSEMSDVRLLFHALFYHV